jgi:D-lactate dehydrogenase (cytochrome)
MTQKNQKYDIHSLKNRTRAALLVTDRLERKTFARDASNDTGEPDLVIFPESVEHLQEIVKWAGENQCPVIPRGAATGLAGGAVASQGGMIVQFSKLNTICNFKRNARQVCVEPGLVNQNLYEFVREHGLYYPPDPASGRVATIGGNIATNAGGPHCFKYGVTSNYLTGLEVILADGTFVQLGGSLLDFPEINLTTLIAGSEGTLALISKANIRLIAFPPAVKTLMVAFKSVHQACEAVSAVIAAGLIPSTLEFMDQKMMLMIEEFTDAGLPVSQGAALIIEVDGHHQSLQSQVEELISILQTKHATEIKVADTEEERARIWYGRKSAAGAMARMAPAYFMADGTVPRSKLAESLDFINRICLQQDLRVGYIFHAGDGNLHPFILINDLEDTELMDRIHEAARQILSWCIELDGSITGEHGVGIEKVNYMPMMYTDDELRTMQDIKSVFDPQSILNPGKVLPELPRAGASDTTPLEEEIPQEWFPQNVDQAASYLVILTQSGKKVSFLGNSTKVIRKPVLNTVIGSRHLDEIIQYSPEDLYITAGSGLSIARLQEAIQADGFWVPHISPWEHATIGGIIASNLNSPLRMRFGGLQDLVLSLKVVLPDGRIIRTGRPVVKNVAGYNLTGLFIGSHGSMGFITEASLKISTFPRVIKSLIVSPIDLKSALGIGIQLLPECVVASSVLVTNKPPGSRETGPGLLITFSGHLDDVEAEISVFQKVFTENGYDALVGESDVSGSEIWGDWINHKHNQVINSESDASLWRYSVPLDYLPEFVMDLAEGQENAEFFTDIANGMIYVLHPYSRQNKRKIALEAGGYGIFLACSENTLAGIGRRGYKADNQNLVKSIKKRWDPAGILADDWFGD